MKHKRYRKLANQVLDSYLKLHNTTVFKLIEADIVKMGNWLSDICEAEEKGEDHVFARVDQAEHA